VSASIGQITGKPLAASVITAAWPDLTFTDDPLATTIQTAADHAVAVGLGKRVDLTKLVDVTLLNQVLTIDHESQV
jgi:NitT/TauT family transport system substrate-binding protein